MFSKKCNEVNINDFKIVVNLIDKEKRAAFAI